MVLPPVRPAAPFAVFLLVVLLAPLTSAQIDAPNPLDPEEQPLPDLIAGSLSQTPNAPHEKDTIRLCGDVRDLSDVDVVQRFDVVFRINGIDEGSVRITETLRANNAVRVCHNFTLSPGEHSWTVIADASREVAEKNESNNVASPGRLLRVTTEPRANLVLTSVTIAPRVSQPGVFQSFQGIVKNTGKLDSPETSLDISDENGHLVRLRVPPLRPGDSTSAPLWASNPDLRPVGNFTARFHVDPDNLVLEEREWDNEGELAYTVSEHPAPDLVIGDVRLTGEPIARKTQRIDARVDNVGDRTSLPTRLQLVVFNETGVQRLVINQSVQGIRVGASQNVTFIFTLAKGNHTLRLVADPDQAVAERVELNNGHELVLDIAESSAALEYSNLVVQSLDAAPDDPRPGEPVLLTALVANLGDQEAGETEVAFHVDGVFVGKARTPRLAPTRTVTVSYAWAAPGPGDVVLRAIVDPADGVKETDETDNAYDRAFTLQDAAPANPTPTTPTPTSPTPTTPPPTTTPTPPTPTTPDTTVTLSPVTLSDLRVEATPAPGRVLANASITIRNPNLAEVSGLLVAFQVEGQTVKEVLVGSMRPAATRVVTSGPVEVPEGKHAFSVQVRRVGEAAPSASAESTYDQAAGGRGIPAPGVLGLSAAIAAAAIVLALPRNPRK